MLIIFGGLPGTGKTTISKQLAKQLKATYLRVDTVEQALKTNGPEGYEVCYAIAAENLRLGLNVIADSVNSISITRNAWCQIAEQENILFVEIEIICSNTKEHQRRIESRKADILRLF
jgi:predicted kinase